MERDLLKLHVSPKMDAVSGGVGHIAVRHAVEKNSAKDKGGWK